MSKNSAHRGTIRLRSAGLGRERWDVRPLHRRPLLAEAVEQELGGREGIRRVSANPVTGRILVHFDAGRYSAGQLKPHIEQALQQALLNALDVPQKDGEAAVPEWDPSFTARTAARLLDKDLVAVVGQGDALGGKLNKPVALSSLDALLKILSPVTLGILVATPLSNGFPLLAKIGLTTKTSQFVFLGASFLALKTAESYVDYRTSIAWDQYSQEAEKELRAKVFDKIQAMDSAYLEDQTPQKLMSIVDGDIDKIKEFLNFTPRTVLRKWLTIGVGTGVLAVVSPVSLLLTLLPAPYLYYLDREHHKNAGRDFGAVSIAKGKVNHRLSANINGAATVKSFVAEHREAAGLDAETDRLRESQAVAGKTNAKFLSKHVYAFTIGICAPLVYASHGMMSGRFSLAEVMVQMTLAPIMLEASTGMNQVQHQYQSAQQAARNIAELMAVEPRIVSGGKLLDRATVTGAIRFEKVDFSYGDTEIFRELDFAVAANQTIGLVGPTGSGKSTLIKLLQRFYDVNSGHILLDGHDLRDLNLADLRGSVGVVSQDTFLFNTSIYDNVLYGRPEASREEVMAACEAAEMMDFVNEQPEGFDTVIGDRGQKLSGGQRQRISIARTVLKDPAVLILDEATSSVDNETEAAIQRSMARLAEQRTTIIIAHRLSSVRNADCIYFLKDGAFHEQGTHAELLAAAGAYAQLWHLQVADGTVAVPETAQ
ncbi:ABC transporter ATP-binding protein/permease [Acanthopleuribacter pedis]|uniref:ABC transporter ATP-binding protein n=1 Tax=Acanthopleuribacter pedis TaxID=442870 RepID=A0A8J7Q6S0_9BACT|nr:ABC transporter ATP-binding protein/permease [Acanthopleuribacter pedis]MBO1317794.1 ABC transporter ATP-binding protein [Acanthopleuribacter pedis]